jgi:hypothetical protein
VCEFNTNDRQVGQLDGNFLDVAVSHAGVEEQRPLFANDQITNGLFGLVRFVDGENAPGWPVNLEPWVADRNVLKIFVFRVRQRTAPLRHWSLTEESRRLQYTERKNESTFRPDHQNEPYRGRYRESQRHKPDNALQTTRISL